MQSEVISNILEVEDRADGIVTQARAQARDILADADRKSAEIIREAVLQEREAGKQAIEDEEAHVAEQVQSYEEQLNSDGTTASTISPKKVDAIADAIIKRICRTVFQADGNPTT